MTTPAFGLNFDYRCPFARILHEHVVVAQKAGAGFEITFEPFTLSQGHVAPGKPPAWEDPAYDADLLALEVGLAVRDLNPEQFLDVHLALFTARHDEGVTLRTRAQVTTVLEQFDVDAASIFAYVDGGTPRAEIAATWTRRAGTDQVFGVPTFFVNDQAVFVRYMERPTDNPQDSIDLIQRLVDLMVNESAMNEFKHTTLPR
ncbi:MAG: DsbA family protein [Actinomycetota bacterium]